MLGIDIHPTATDRLRRASDLVIATTAGLGISAVAYAAMTRSLPNSISRFFLERAYSEGGGTNDVHVILVDFRSLDTLGEIPDVGVVAAIGKTTCMEKCASMD